MADFDPALLDRQRQRRLGLRRPNSNRFAREALHQSLADHVAQSLQGLVAALGGSERDDVAHLGVVDGVLEPIGEHGVAVGHVEADVDLEALPDLALRLSDTVVRVGRKATNIDLDARVQAFPVSLHEPGRYQRTAKIRAVPRTLQEFTIKRRYRGPPDSANGGYACGTLARLIDSSAAE